VFTLQYFQQLTRDGCVACLSEARGEKPAKAGFFISGRSVHRTRIYIDGYNLYYGCLKGSSLKWLDLLSLFEKSILPSVTALSQRNERLLPTLLPLAIKFFTAPILEKAASAEDSLKCQDAYHSAISRHQPGRLEIIKGYYSLTESRAKLIDVHDPKKWARDCQSVEIWKLEEKQTDVNLALHAFKDAVMGEVDHVVIVTNDTDIAPALSMIRSLTRVTIGLVIPTTNHERYPNNDLSNHAHWIRTHITSDELKASQLPRTITHGKKAISKPDSWYTRPALLQQALELGKSELGSRSKVFQWLSNPNPNWDGHTPLEILESAEGEVVVEFMKTWAAKGA